MGTLRGQLARERRPRRARHQGRGRQGGREDRSGIGDSRAGAAGDGGKKNDDREKPSHEEAADGWRDTGPTDPEGERV